MPRQRVFQVSALPEVANIKKNPAICMILQLQPNCTTNQQESRTICWNTGYGRESQNCICKWHVRTTIYQRGLYRITDCLVLFCVY